MAGFRKDQITERVREIVSKYVSKETNGRSLITVTTVDMSEKADHATVFITVMPEKEEDTALEFLKRKRKEIRKEIMKNLPIARIPFVEIAIDKGQKLADKITSIEIEERERSKE